MPDELKAEIHVHHQAFRKHGMTPELIASSEEIVENLEAWLDEWEEEPAAPAPAPPPAAPTPTPAPAPQPQPSKPAAAPAPKPAPQQPVNVTVAHNDRVFERMYEEGCTSGISLDTLRRYGFDFARWKSPDTYRTPHFVLTRGFFGLTNYQLKKG
ncbi:hypothetical protein [Catalinimonas alkaloidigena]|uniref:hypothetical protein n=1 Tax=Catalinimonas alkaloidigena TaxID=1075417 RepID=UPI001C409EEF|nr:hypothetical protein [Catalinimonas alkaloidigena]